MAKTKNITDYIHCETQLKVHLTNSLTRNAVMKYQRHHKAPNKVNERMTRVPASSYARMGRRGEGR